MILPQAFKTFVEKHQLFTSNDHLLLAVSGGVDSMVLAALCHQCNYRFSIAHCNFQLRGEESDADETMVRERAANYGVDFFSKKFDTSGYALHHKVSIQLAARELRYAWFRKLLKLPALSGTSSSVYHNTFLITAHHADDNVETVLMNLFKGTGMRGLQGIPMKIEKIRRPLLFARKSEIGSYAKEKEIAFAEDASNAESKYTRNFIRNEIMPFVKNKFPEAEKNILGTIDRINSAVVLYSAALKKTINGLIEKKGNELHIPVLKLSKTPSFETVLFEIVKDHGFTSAQLPDVAALLQADTGKAVYSLSHSIFRNRKWLIIAPILASEANHILITDSPSRTAFEGGTLLLENVMAKNVRHLADPMIEYVDAVQLSFPLLLRRWGQGDYFFPLGIKKPNSEKRGKKKLSKFFIDQKLSLSQKQQVWVLESNKKIVWVVGHRLDDRFKITASSGNIMKLSLRNV